MQRLVAGGGLKAPHEVADAHAVLAGDVLEAEFLCVVGLKPFPDLQDAGYRRSRAMPWATWAPQKRSIRYMYRSQAEVVPPAQ